MEQLELNGLDQDQIDESRKKHGDNYLSHKQHFTWAKTIIDALTDPMVLLLFAGSTVYFLIGNQADGAFLAIGILLISAISSFQNFRSNKALAELEQLADPVVDVIRAGRRSEVSRGDIVVGDILVVDEGKFVAADGQIIRSNDFSVDESILTGESLPVYKDENSNSEVFSGTIAVTGLAFVKVTAVGDKTQLGTIGSRIEGIKTQQTPLELQIKGFVKKMALVGGVVFLAVWIINFRNTGSVLESLIQALTLAMSILPEEIPVAFSTFMALGAWRLAKIGVIVKQTRTVETLGSATVICTDKTGTITQNKMALAALYAAADQQVSGISANLTSNEKELVRWAMWASEPVPFDPMEIALHAAYKEMFPEDERRHYQMEFEYPLSGKPPMMTHVFHDSKGSRIIAAKGAPEAIFRVAAMAPEEFKKADEASAILAAQGYRVLGVANASFDGSTFPSSQEDLPFAFAGLVAFFDPPKENIRSVFNDFYNAGITVKIITGDNQITTRAIAQQSGFRGYDKLIDGEVVMGLSESALRNCVKENFIFYRMFPEAKLKVINALKENNEIVAMTGDGVNDGPALKAAHIGIAMGKKGSEIAKGAASLILVDDDLQNMVHAIAVGRRIYSNLKKAVQYIISIHIPIILVVFIPLVLGWVYPNIFSPIHIIFLEMVMGPTCSIVYENEPLEGQVMRDKPRPFTTTFFSTQELSISIFQGLMIACGVLSVYKFGTYRGFDEALVRTMVFTTLVSSNIVLTLVNRSFHHSIFTTLKYKNSLIAVVLIGTIIISGLIIYIKTVAAFFEFTPLHLWQLALSIGVGFIFTIWYEIPKWMIRKSHRN